MNWEQLDSLRDDHVAPETIAAAARNHGLDLPHEPTIRRTDIPGTHEYEVGCQACTLREGSWQTRCSKSRFVMPARVTDVEGLLTGVRAAYAEISSPLPPPSDEDVRTYVTEIDLNDTEGIEAYMRSIPHGGELREPEYYHETVRGGMPRMPRLGDNWKGTEFLPPPGIRP